MELVDMVIINKADGDLVPIAKRAMAEYKTALNLMVPKSDLWTPPIKLCSAKDKLNISVFFWVLAFMMIF
jgi:LAO/AO transport system kinase